MDNYKRISEYATKLKIEKILAQYMKGLDEKKCNESKSNYQYKEYYIYKLRFIDWFYLKLILSIL